VSTVTYLVGDVFDQLATLEPDSVDLVLTSPPFLALRSYLPADHPDKGREIGSEPTPAAFVDTLLDVVEALDRVLAPHGSVVIELGDTYSGSGGAGGDYNQDGLRAGQPVFRQVGSREHRPERSAHYGPKDAGVSHDVPVNGGTGWPLAKSLALVPESFRWALAYGRNPFNGRPTPPWRVRNVIRWCRPNPPVGALGDKFRPATTELVVACHSDRRYFDLDAVRTAGSANTHARLAQGVEWRERTAKTCPDGNRASVGEVETTGAPPLDWWDIPTEPYPGAHYATWPSALCVVPVKAMCPERVCTACGQPSRRIVERTPEYAAYRAETGDFLLADKNRRATVGCNAKQAGLVPNERYICTGWTDCGHDAWRPGVVLDPFCGSGTTLAVAHGHGRSAIGIDLDERNRDLALERVGMWLAEPSRPVVDVQLELVLS
jgi:hypothetical protein